MANDIRSRGGNAYIRKLVEVHSAALAKAAANLKDKVRPDLTTDPKTVAERNKKAAKNV